MIYKNYIYGVVVSLKCNVFYGISLNHSYGILYFDRWFSKNMPEAQWQKDFFDYLHRKERDLKEHIFYILDNPVREDIVKNWKDYPYKGSLDLNLHEIICLKRRL